MLAACLLLTGCASRIGVMERNEQESQEAGEDNERPQIALIFDSFVIERWEKDRDIFISTAKDLGADVIVSNANGVAEDQADLVERMIEQKVKVIVIVPIDSQKLVEPIEKAHHAGIKVISYDRIVENAGTDLYITFDNVMVGTYMAQCLNKNLKEGGKYLMLAGAETDNNVEMVELGFNREIRGDLKLLDRMNCSNWDDELAYQYLSEHTKLLQEADAIVCGNDAIAGQAVRVLAENRRAGRCIVTGQDADLEACQRLNQGTQAMTVYKPIESLARSAAQQAVHMAEGEAAATDARYFDGTIDVPYIAFKPVMVDKNNMKDTVIADGFYLENEVYQ